LDPSSPSRVPRRASKTTSEQGIAIREREMKAGETSRKNHFFFRLLSLASPAIPNNCDEYRTVIAFRRCGSLSVARGPLASVRASNRDAGDERATGIGSDAVVFAADDG
jgi:hypothetical protein